LGGEARVPEGMSLVSFPLILEERLGSEKGCLAPWRAVRGKKKKKKGGGMPCRLFAEGEGGEEDPAKKGTSASFVGKKRGRLLVP